MIKKFAIYFCLLLLIIIHTIDMQLTEIYIGNVWELESFPPMQYCIKKFGIYYSLWISRIIFYAFVYMLLIKMHNKYWQLFLVVTTILYYTTMVGWLFTLGILDWDKILSNF